VEDLQEMTEGGTSEETGDSSSTTATADIGGDGEVGNVVKSKEEVSEEAELALLEQEERDNAAAVSAGTDSPGAAAGEPGAEVAPLTAEQVSKVEGALDARALVEKARTVEKVTNNMRTPATRRMLYLRQELVL